MKPTLLNRVLIFCLQVGGYEGPQETEAVDMLSKFDYDEYGQQTPYKRAFELGYKRGYADCAQYLSDWIEDDDEEA